MNRQLLVNKIKTPDGTILESRHRHDYKEYVDCLSGETYIVDGGHDYIRRSVNTAPYEEMSLYDDDDFELIREHFTWGTYGESGKEKLKYVALKNLDIQHIHNLIGYLEMRGFQSHVLLLMIKELEYRGEKKNGNNRVRKT